MSGRDWTSEDMGAAMVAAARSYASVVKDRRDGSVDCNAWWRGGDDPNVRIWPRKGAAHDVKQGETYNARDFARVALGVTLPELMERYGSLPRDDLGERAAAAIVASFEQKRPAPDLTEAWEGIVAAGNTEPAARWLIARGFPDDVATLVESGFAALDAGGIGELPSDMARHAEAMGREHGPCLLAPLRSVDDNAVRGLHCRPLDGGKGRHLKGSRLTTEHGPSAYGFAGAARRSGLVVLTEGLADTFTAEAWLRDVGACVVVGAPDVHGFERLAADLVEHPLEGRRVVLIPHLDDDKALRDKAAAAVRLMRDAGIRSALFGWPAFLDALRAAGEPDAFKVVRDLADAPKHAQRAPWDAQRAAFLDTIERLEWKP